MHATPTASICIIDDDEAVRDSLAILLEACGYAVVGFASALTFLNGTDIAAYLCLLVDLHMPGMSGLELLELLRGRGVETPAALITAAADAMIRSKAAHLPDLVILEKPVDGDLLLATIEGFAAR